MVYNSDIGKYNYSSNNYKLNSINYNQKGIDNLSNRAGNIHQIKFNSYKQATEIYLQGKDRISFEFNPFKSRSIAYFGSENVDKNARPYRKYYSSDNAIEIIKKDGLIKVVTYIDGDPYSSSYIKVDQFNIASGINNPNNYYLHRDYQGSIVALSNTDGRVVEKRYFDAWGNIKQVIHTSWNGTVPTNITNQTLGIIDRGYTGHEHLQSVGLIHMNGRLYDPLIRRFLSPDNFVQDSYNTQNFDRYTYVYNNPLIYSDPSGEIAFLAAIGIAAAISVGTNMIMNLIQGVPIWYGIGKSAVVGGISGAISFGIGTAATSIGSGIAKASFQVVAHGLSGAIMSEIDGGNGISGMLSGMISSAISSAVQGLTSTTFYADEDYTQLVTVTKDKALSDVLTVAAGTLSGGISASISGGNFWQGIRQGAITSGLNYIADHTLQKKKLPYTLIEDELYNHANIDVYTAKPPSISYDTADDLINKMPSLKSLKKQAKGYNLAGGRINSGKDPNGIQYGLTNHDNKTIYLYKETFTTWQKLALSIGHELMHAVHRTSGTWQSWYNTGGSSYAKNMTEYNAYNWEFIYTSQRGTFGSLEGLTKYGKLLGKTIPTPSSSHSNLFWH